MNEISRQAPDERRLGFDDLPNELKLHILSFALVHPEPITVHNHSEVEDEDVTKLAGLIRTSHAVRALAREVYYSSNTLIVQRSYGDNPFRLGYGDGEFKFRYPPAVFGHFVQRLQLSILASIDATTTSELLAFSSSRMQRQRGALGYNDWLILLRPLSSGAKHNSGWQAHFPHLDVLCLTIAVDGCFERNEHMRNIIEDLQQQFSIDIRPRKMDLEMDGSQFCACHPECETKLLDTIRSMIKLRSDN
jgi:hypothetical protein